MRPALEFCEKYDGIYFIADLHALTSNRNPDLLASQTFDHLATWLAIGLDTEKHTLFRQSDIREHTELSWFLSCVTNLGLLEKSHAFKDAVSQGADVNHGLFAYPVLMAADILLYDADVVPVGKDQKQHVEMARDIAGAFNAIYGDVLKLPEPVIQEEVKLIPGLDGRKMSKSYGNEIALLCPEKELRKKLLSLKTDSTPLEEPKALQGSLVGDLFVLFASAEQFADLEVRLARGGMGWGHAKEELFGVINEHVRPARDRYNELRSDEGYLREVLNRGAEKARAIASPTMSRVRHAVGIR
jgi:tryptophanyl-tRNA synthetase